MKGRRDDDATVSASEVTKKLYLLSLYIMQFPSNQTYKTYGAAFVCLLLYMVPGTKHETKQDPTKLP